jgi:hypothetical protein
LMAGKVTSLRLSEEDFRVLDRKRGKASRTAFLRRLIHDYGARPPGRAPKRGTLEWALWNLEQLAEFDAHAAARLVELRQQDADLERMRALTT